MYTIWNLRQPLYYLVLFILTTLSASSLFLSFSIETWWTADICIVQAAKSWFVILFETLRPDSWLLCDASCVLCEAWNLTREMRLKELYRRKLDKSRIAALSNKTEVSPKSDKSWSTCHWLHLSTRFVALGPWLNTQCIVVRPLHFAFHFQALLKHADSWKPVVTKNKKNINSNQESGGKWRSREIWQKPCQKKKKKIQKKTREKSRKNNTENGSERRVLSTSRPRPHRLHARDSTCVFCQVKNRDSMEYSTWHQLWQYHDTEGFVAFAFLYFSMITVYFTVIQVDSGWMRLRVEGCNSEPKWHRAFKCGTWWNWCFRFASSIDICRVFQILLCGVAFCHEIHVSLCILHTALRSENNVTGRSASHVASKAFLDLRSWGSSSRTKCHLGEGSYWVASLDRKRKKERCHLRKIHEKDEKPYIQ